MSRARRRTAFGATRSEATEATRTRTAGEAVRAKPPRCVGIAMDKPTTDSEASRGAGFRGPLVAVGLSLSALAGLGAQGCLDPRETKESSDVARCATCHGDPNRSGDFLLRAAPPRDVLGSTDPSYPGVGAHQVHLRASATHAAIACDECHKVPERTDSPGHADSPAPAELTFGTLARTGDRNPSYEDTRTCRDTYCHREANAVWTEPRDSDH